MLNRFGDWWNWSICARWRDIFAYALAGIFAFEVFLPLGARMFRAISPISDYSPGFVLLLCMVGTAVSAFIVTEPIKVRVGHWRHVFRYPPLWLAPTISFLTALGVARVPLPNQPLSNDPDWEHAWLVSGIAAAFVLAVGVRQIPWQKRPRRRTVVNASEDALKWDTLRDWFVKEGPTDRDLFGHAPIATRISNTLMDQSAEQAIALLGPYGSGKSSIVARVRRTLEDSDSPFFVIAEFNGWAIPQAADAPRVALASIIDALGGHVDMQRFRGLPDAYKRLVAAEPSGALSKILGTSDDSDPLAHLKRLEAVLDALNARVVLFIEDADRAGNRFESRHLERLLTILREVKRVSFVLSIDGTRAPQFDYRKLCDIIELVPPLDPEYVVKILGFAYRHWISEPFIDPRTKRESVLYLDQEPNELMTFYRRRSKDNPIYAIASLLQSPRRLKHLIRRVDRVWRNLRGEVDLDDLIIVSVLRDLENRKVFEFLADNIDSLRTNEDDR